MADDLVARLEAVAERIDFIAPGMAGWDDMTEGKICRKAAIEIAELRQQRDHAIDEGNATSKLYAELRQRERGLRRERITGKEYVEASEAILTELKYQDSLERRTDDEAKDVPGFLTLLRRYTRIVEDSWSDNPGTPQEDGSVQVEQALHGLRKLAAICVRAMIYNGIRARDILDEAPTA